MEGTPWKWYSIKCRPSYSQSFVSLTQPNRADIAAKGRKPQLPAWRQRDKKKLIVSLTL